MAYPARSFLWRAVPSPVPGFFFFFFFFDPKMLPVNSMRFFRLDPEWIKCLLEGACSVGRSTSEEQLVDEKLRGAFFDLVMEKCDSVRQRPPEDDVLTIKETAGVNWPLEGFLLRSPIVEGWQGLEMEASYWQGKEVKPGDGSPYRPAWAGHPVVYLQRPAGEDCDSPAA